MSSVLAEAVDRIENEGSESKANWDNEWEKTWDNTGGANWHKYWNNNSGW